MATLLLLIGSYSTNKQLIDQTLLKSSSWLHANTRLDANDPTSSFVEGLGAGQIVSRQALASPYLGDIQLSLSDRKGNLEVEIIRARRLQSKPGSKTLPCK